MQVKKTPPKGMTQEIKPLSENVLVSQRCRESLNAVNKPVALICWNAALSLSVLSTLKCSRNKVEIAMSFQSGQKRGSTTSNLISVHLLADTHLLSVSRSVCISVRKQVDSRKAAN